ncbi:MULTISPECIES: TetR/AcrR family transcriptional regulator C-terminal ligand-binding domain-containing protein [unclassified Streptomyces]|uniref:TetR/AcrR family transcriptional regulator n=1 Tax=unclassified Streptomyces TaxID=2593676 RepID=UPI001F0E77C2|nr:MULTISPECIES: TetR/AcrR family transcriptional regulator C-terminal ligand-binding domain-containing protein [unclassified Streptomyces]
MDPHPHPDPRPDPHPHPAPAPHPDPDPEPCVEGGPRRGRPRSEAAERAIFDAVIALLEGGVPLGDISIERIARTAGVGKATIYRRWAGKEDLLVELIRSVEPPDPELPGVSVRDDLVMMLEFMRRRGLAKRSSALLRNMFTQMQAYPRLWDQYHRTAIEPRRRRGIEVLERGVATGEVRADLDLDLVNDLFIGPLLLRTVLQPDADLSPDFPARVADAILDGVRPKE